MYLSKELFWLPEVNSSKRIYGNNNVFAGISVSTLDRDTILLISETVKRFNSLLSASAPLVDVVGVLTGYELILTDKNCGGYCDYANKKIALSKSSFQKKHFGVVFHEISHALQYRTNGIIHKYPLGELSSRITIEQQCETMAFFIYNSTISTYRKAKNFDAYTKHSDFVFLNEWYGDHVVNDMLPECPQYFKP